MSNPRIPLRPHCQPRIAVLQEGGIFRRSSALTLQWPIGLQALETLNLRINPKPKTQNPKPETLNPRVLTEDLGRMLGVPGVASNVGALTIRIGF